MAIGGHAAETGGPRVLDQPSPQWWLYQGTGQPLDPAERDRRWPKPPPWRNFPSSGDLPAPPADDAETRRRLGDDSVVHTPDFDTVTMINAAICLSRPLIVTGRPGCGKSALAHMISRELGLGRVLRWPIASRTTLHEGLYQYDAIGRAQAIGDANDSYIGNFVHLGPLGTALLPHRLPRVLLIDEMDKGDIDLPNDLLSVFEEGEFQIPELVRIRDRESEVTVYTADAGKAPIRDGIVQCHAFPIVVITTNGEREFPPALLRRCLTVNIPEPDKGQLAEMVAAHFLGSDGQGDATADLISKFVEQRTGKGGLSVDQLLNAVHLTRSGAIDPQDNQGTTELLDAIWHRLSAGSL